MNIYQDIQKLWQIRWNGNSMKLAFDVMWFDEMSRSQLWSVNVNRLCCAATEHWLFALNLIKMFDQNVIFNTNRVFNDLNSLINSHNSMFTRSWIKPSLATKRAMESKISHRNHAQRLLIPTIIFNSLLPGLLPFLT